MCQFSCTGHQPGVLQFKCDTNYLSWCRPHREGPSRPRRPLPLHSTRFSGTHTLPNLASRTGQFPWSPAQVGWFARRAQRTQRNTNFYGFIIKNKGYRWSGTSVRSRAQELPSSQSMDCATILAHGRMCSPSWNLFEPHTLQIFMDASSHGHASLLTPS